MTAPTDDRTREPMRPPTVGRFELHRGPKRHPRPVLTTPPRRDPVTGKLPGTRPVPCPGCEHFDHGLEECTSCLCELCPVCEGTGGWSTDTEDHECTRCHGLGRVD